MTRPVSLSFKDNCTVYAFVVLARHHHHRRHRRFRHCDDARERRLLVECWCFSASGRSRLGGFGGSGGSIELWVVELGWFRCLVRVQESASCRMVRPLCFVWVVGKNDVATGFDDLGA